MKKLLQMSLVVSLLLLAFVINQQRNSKPTSSGDQIPVPGKSLGISNVSLDKSLFGEKSIKDGEWDGGSGTFTDEVTISLIPTENITIKYDNEVRPLPQMKKYYEIFSTNKTNELYREQKLESYKKFGELALRFMSPSDGGHITDVIKADVTSDGVVDNIITFIKASASASDIQTIVADKENILFETVGYQQNVISSESGNGFYVKTPNNNKAETGYYLTRFVFKEGKFVPIFEQEVRYLKVND